MQVIWVSGPAAKVVTWSITARTVLLALAAASSCLVILGFVFNLIGLRVAVEYVPELAQRMGGVTSQSEQQKMEAIYRHKLDALNSQLSTVTERLHELESVKNEVLGRLGIEKLFTSSLPGQGNLLVGRGGPLNLLPRWGFSARNWTTNWISLSSKCKTMTKPWRTCINAGKKTWPGLTACQRCCPFQLISH